MPKSLKRIPLAGWIVIGLVLGAAAGLALPTPGKTAWSDTVVASADVVARLWLAALQMTILPLVFALLSTTFVRSGGLSASEGVARRTIVVVLALYLLAVFVGIVFTPILLALSPVTPEIAGAMRSAGGGPVAVPHLPVADMILGAVPTNIVSAAASGSLLPVLVFALVFGAALARIGSERNVAIVAVLEDSPRRCSWSSAGSSRWCLSASPVSSSWRRTPAARRCCGASRTTLRSTAR
ncbi:MAG TPA: cation:dicarboxylase symporter family transporter [Croceibacterium sp.]|nr:cation:dicarboxylase symporter family transporter [Croceibacterium sp.]